MFNEYSITSTVTLRLDTLGVSRSGQASILIINYFYGYVPLHRRLAA